MWDKLNQRERFLLTLTLLFVFIIGIFFMIRLISQKRSELKQNIEKTRLELQTLIRLRDDISRIPNISNLPNRNELLTLITQKLQELQLTPNNIRDREEKSGNKKIVTVELSFNGINLQKLFQFIYEIEYNRNGIKISELLIRKPLPGRDIYDVRMNIYVEQME